VLFAPRMKILGFILAVLMLAGTAFVTLAAANKAHKLAGDLATATQGLSADELKLLSKEVGDVPSTGRLNGGAVVGGLGGLAAIVLLIAAFAKKQWVTALGGVTVACAALSAVIYPYVKTGPLDGAAPRSLALVAIALAVVGAGGALLAARKPA
jgi:hypothetical protein